MKNAIGVFDSGIGGVTVLKALVEKLPNENFIYLGDTARLPYGSKSPDTIEKYVQQNIAYLLSQKVKAIVVACNSASTAVLGREHLYPVPVYNVIGPGADRACTLSKSGKIGVLGTRATIIGGAYVSEIKKRWEAAEISGKACPLLVPLVEEGWESDPVTEEIVSRYVVPFHQTHQFDTLIMGCTHYPILRKVIAKVLGLGVELVDSAETVAQRIFDDLAKNLIMANKEEKREIEVYVTDTSPTFIEVARRLLSPVLVGEVQVVDINDLKRNAE